MAQTATNPKIEELRARIKADPKSRLFYQLAEELRRNGQAAEAEQILRSGLSVHPTYLAAWVSLGRVCRELKNDRAAVDALVRALQLDPGNVVAARLLGDAHLALGDKVEAIKKYKLVYALLPADEELEGIIERLDRELHPPAPSAEPLPEEAEDAAPVTEPQPALPEEIPPSAGLPEAFEEEPEPMASRPEAPPAETESPLAQAPEESPFDKTQPPFAEASPSLAEEVGSAFETADAEPMLRAHEESPFEEPVGGYTAASAEIESIPGISIESAPLQAEVPARAPGASTIPEAAEPEAITAGAATDEMRALPSERLDGGPLAEPGAGAAGQSSGADRVARLERWLARVSRKEAHV